MGIYLALAAGLIGLSVLLRTLRLAVVVVLGLLVVDWASGQGPTTAVHLLLLL